MHLCISQCEWIFVHVCVCVHVCEPEDADGVSDKPLIHIYIYIHTYIHTYIQWLRRSWRSPLRAIYIYIVLIHTYMYLYSNWCWVLVYTYIHTYIHTYSDEEGATLSYCIYIHTYIHTYIQWRRRCWRSPCWATLSSRIYIHKYVRTYIHTYSD